MLDMKAANPQIKDDTVKKQLENDRYKKSAFADIRVKLGDKNMQEKEELPSDVSENAWDEVPKYQAMKYKYD